LVNIDEATYISSLSPDTNFGSSTVLNIYSWITFFLYTLINIGNGLEADFFKLKLYQTTTDAKDFKVYIADSSWVEGTVTYNNRPAPGDEIGSFTLLGEVGYQEYEITGLTSQQISDINSNGLILVKTLDENLQATFTSDDGVNVPQYAYGAVTSDTSNFFQLFN